MDVALRAKAIAEVTNHRPTTTWEDDVPRDSTLPPPTIDDVMSWLPTSARVLFAQQNAGACHVVAAFGRSFAQVSAYMDQVEAMVAADDPATARDIGQAILDKIPAPKDGPDTARIFVWSQGDDGPKANQTVISTQRWAEIERNYPEDTRQELTELVKYSPGGGPSGRLILFHGPAGTGKTHAIRALVAEWESWCDAELVVDPENALHDYRYLQRLLALKRPRIRQTQRRWRLVVAEDADRFIRSDERAAGNEALDRLLNATDGILGQRSRTIFLLTTNVELSTINAALSRPGRCLSAIAFEPFKPGEARAWLGADAPIPTRALTLAELYERKHGTRRERHRQTAVFGQYL